MYSEQKKCKLLFHIIRNIQKHIISKKKKKESLLLINNESIHFKIKFNIMSYKKI